jgi:hypothetical protein
MRPPHGYLWNSHVNGNIHGNSNSRNTDDTDVTEPTRISRNALFAYP